MVSAREILWTGLPKRGVVKLGGIAYSNEIDGDLLIHVDPDAMEMVFLNIIKTARKPSVGMENEFAQRDRMSG